MKIIELLSSDRFTNKKVLEKIICHHLFIDREKLFVSYDLEIDKEVVNKILFDYDQFVIHKKPLEYIFGYVEFFGRKFEVTKDTLIPRPETEYMIDSINEFIVHNKKEYVLLDIGTGCGVLGLSVLLDNQDNIFQTYLTDITDESLEVCARNYKKYFPEGSNLQIIRQDLFDFTQDILSSLENKDIILIANLPYIPDMMFDDNVEENVKKWEPRVAFVGGEDGADLYRKMFDQILSSGLLGKSRITMFLEMLDVQADKLTYEYRDRLCFDKVATFHFNIKILKVSF